MTCKNLFPDITYNVFGGTLNLALSICLSWCTMSDCASLISVE